MKDMNDAFRPGQVWLDTEGKPIQAHGGSVYYENNKFYWYGENKELTDGINGIWHNGVRCYSSEDLYHWKDKGIIIPAEEDEKSTLNRKNCMDRPHIVYNESTRKYVCFLKIMENSKEQSMTILDSDSLLGPYVKIKEHFKPFGFNCGDFDLVKTENGRVYWYFEKVHSELICAELTDDYHDVKERYSVHFPHPEGVPYVREAPAHFERNGHHYLITSGTSGYYPNPSEIAVSEDYHGPFKVTGRLHIGDDSDTSFHSQISSVFKVPFKKDLYIAIADRWLPEAMNLSYNITREVFELYNSGKYGQALEIVRSLNLSVENTSKATYVWLPIVFDGEVPYIKWHDCWKYEDWE